MSDDRIKLLKIMNSLEEDYRSGKISAEKYSYFRSKYEDKLNSIDAQAATRRIRSMQGKPSSNNKKRRRSSKKSSKNKKKEEQDLVQKYIINPKKGDKQIEEKAPMDSGTYKLLAILILALGFTVGAGFGVFSFDFASFADTNASAIVTDTAFPDVADINVNATASNNTVSNTSSSATNTQIQTTTDTSYSSSSSSSSSGSGSYDGGGSSQGGGSSEGGSSSEGGGAAPT